MELLKSIEIFKSLPTLRQIVQEDSLNKQVIKDSRGYLPMIYFFDGNWNVCWQDDEGCMFLYFERDTLEGAIKAADDYLRKILKLDF